jgi:predicted RNase H-like HicB family nuclease
MERLLNESLVDRWLARGYIRQTAYVSEDQGGYWESWIPQFGRTSLAGSGSTPVEAMATLEEALKIGFTMMAEAGEEPEPPIDIDSIECNCHRKVSALIRLQLEGTKRFRVFTPFTFGDGDYLGIVLKYSDNQWTLSDEGHTFMHLTCNTDETKLKSGTLLTAIANTLEVDGIQDDGGELVLPIENDRYGDALFHFIHGILKIVSLKERR